MVGFYPAPPGRRMPYDRDGSAVVQWNGTVLTSYSNVSKAALNDETSSGPANGRITTAQFVAIVFPTDQTVVGIFHSSNHAGSGSHTVKHQYSLNTTTGLDGAWTDTGMSLAGADSLVTPDYRTRILTPGSPIASVKGIRTICSALTGTATDLAALHVYGYPTTPTNRLMLWHPTLNQSLAATPTIYDLEDIPRGAGPQIFSFRVKNISPTMTAQSVTVLREALSDGTPTVVSLMELRYNGGSYGTTAAVGNLGPGAISNVVDLKMDVTPLAPVGPWAPRVVAGATSWV